MELVGTSGGLGGRCRLGGFLDYSIVALWAQSEDERSFGEREHCSRRVRGEV